MDTDAAERITADRFAIRARARKLPGEYDDNFLIESDSRGRLVLKISPPGFSLELLDLQNRALEHLGASVTSLRFPRVVPDPEGATVVEVALAGGEGRFARLLEWLPGRPLAGLGPPSAGLLEALGRALGEVDATLAGFDHPAAHRQLQWDLKLAGGQRAEARHIADPRRRALAEWFFLQFDAHVVPALPGLRTSVIHNDANDHNLLVEGEGEAARVTGLLDFGDMIHSATVCEPAVALAYLMMRREDPLEAAEPFLRGYHDAHPLTGQEVDLLYVLIGARLATSVSISARRRAARPGDEYAVVSEAPAWDLLDQLRSLSPGEASRRFRGACGLEGPAREGRTPDDLLELRRRLLGPNLSLSYAEPLKIVRGSGAYLFDHEGRAHLDLVNNVCHVGHSHPRVVEAAARQMAELNTNTRYLHDRIVEYAERLTARLPDPLNVCYLVCSGSEANELALRLARARTGRRDVLVLEGAYHGNTSALVEISPYKFRGAGGEGAPEHVHVAPMPDGYRGPHKGAGAETGRRYAADLEEVLGGARERGREIGAFLCEPLLGCGGQIVPPVGYLEPAFRAVRAAGGVCVADEVQVGFGRVGKRFWSFELQGVVPDIVTLGKPIGNGHPLGAVVTTKEIAASFDTGMEYFNTFGGNPVSCAVGLEVLAVIETEGLQERARVLGDRMLEGFRSLADRHAIIGDVRGEGLFLGVELVRNRETLDPAAAEAAAICDRLRGEGLLLSTDGPLHNVLKVKPPLVLSERDVDRTVDALDRALAEGAL
jgi:4-aminobutyrate aminotransferase-like enzyme/Ser/Thr protein kinase RdoA (MazF antagonist)